MSYRRDLVIFGLLAIVMGALMITRLRTPAYTDGYYYFNAGRRLATGSGLTDAAIWTYLGLPDGLRGLPVPSHLYWMPLTSLVAAGGMLIGGGTFDAGRLPFIPIFAGLGLAAFVLGAQFGGSRRAAWMAGLLTLFGGYFMPFWMNTDTFALYGLTGALALLTMGLGRRSGDPRWFAVSGLFAGLAHLTRADGLLLIGVLVVVALWPRPTANRPAKIALCVLLG
ncbi:MAG TPA: glycosyltransferase family 39 protein, partial [Aggregatilineales bacterium]|nr:glycosyltransferase family 39 protein [Aggregatilineales bacterium]